MQSSGMMATMLLIAGVAAATPVHAGQVSGDATIARVSNGNLAAQNETLFAFSQAGNVVNSSVVAGNIMPGGIIPIQNIVKADGNFIAAGKFPGYANSGLGVQQAKTTVNNQIFNVAICVKNNCSYGPSWTAGDIPKAKVSADTLYSATPVPPNATSTGVAEYIAPGLAADPTSPTGFNMNALVAAGGTVAPGTNGLGAGAAFDPVQVSPGMYAYQVDADATLQLDANQTGGITWFATDSQTIEPATFYGPMEPFNQALWSLSIVENGPITSAADLLNPSLLSITMTLASSSLLSVLDPDGSAYTVTDLENAVRDALTYEDGTATLSDFGIFPSMDPDCGQPGQSLCGTATYYVSGSSVNYGEGVDAGLQSVPEPPSGLLVGALGFLAALVGNRQRV